MKTPVLETERLILRPVTLEDAPSLQKYFNNWNIIGKLSTVVPWPYPDDGAEIFIRDICLPSMESGSFIWTIRPRVGPNEAIGLIDFRLKLRINDAGNRGFWLAEPFHGKGYMTEAVAAVNDFLFFEAGVESFTAANAIANAGSRRVKEKTGAVFLKMIELPHNNGETETQLWEITKENWLKVRNS